MNFYLPIAEMTVNVLVYVGMGAAVGFLSGMFGVGGGFLITPMLMLTGIPPTVAVGTGAAQLVASSISGAIAQYRRRNVDITLGIVLLIGGMCGSVIGVQFVKILRQMGQFELFVSLTYVVFLGAIGSLMMIESLISMRKVKAGGKVSMRRPGQHNWIHGLPFKMRFRRSKLYISVIPPLLLGLFIGVLSAIMGVGGGFIMVPAMIYLLRVPTRVVVGTSQFQIVFVTALTVVLQATANHSVDVVLALFLMIGGVVGSQLGTEAGQRLEGEQLRFLLAALVVIVCFRMGFDLVVTPQDLYSLSPVIGGH